VPEEPLKWRYISVGFSADADSGLPIGRIMPDREQLLPSILDRLIDPASRGTTGRPGYSVALMAAAVQQDLERLLNTRSDDSEGPEKYRLYARVAGYGLPDLATLSRLGDIDKQGICRILEERILRYEPRLKDVHVTLKEGQQGNPLHLELHLRAVLSVDPAPELAFDTVLDLGSGEFRHAT
jgi:type VI secretion system protein ImpF